MPGGLGGRRIAVYQSICIQSCTSSLPTLTYTRLITLRRYVLYRSPLREPQGPDVCRQTV
jgi:hypothetical protein